MIRSLEKLVIFTLGCFIMMIAFSVSTVCANESCFLQFDKKLIPIYSIKSIEKFPCQYDKKKGKFCIMLLYNNASRYPHKTLEHFKTADDRDKRFEELKEWRYKNE